MKKVMVLFDGPNIFWGVKQFLPPDTKIDIQKFLKHIRAQIKGRDQRKLEILKFFYDYNPIEHKTNPYVAYMAALGFETIGVPLTVYSLHQNNTKRFKSQTDAKILDDAYRHLYHYDFDHLVLLSGDSNFKYLIETCQEMRKTVEIWSVSIATMSNDLKKLTGEFYFFDDPAVKHLLTNNEKISLERDKRQYA